jgi:hypothetical protein
VALAQSFKKIKAMQKALNLADNDPGELEKQLYDLKQNLYRLDQVLNGNRSKSEIGEKDKPTVRDRLNFLLYGTSFSTYGPNPSLREGLDIARNELGRTMDQLRKIREEEIPAMARELLEMGAPWIEGQELPDRQP